MFSGSMDEGLRAFLQFMRIWKPEEFEKRGWPEDMKGENVVFSLDGDIGRRYIHERPAARELWTKLLASKPSPDAVCLITGAHSRILDSHPPIKGVDNAQSSGAFIVSFNRTAFVSYGHESAPVSQAAAFAYTTALNHFLERDSGHRVQIGDASTVFWADASDAAAAADAKDIFASLLGVNENVEAKKVGVILDAIRQGRPIAELKPELPKDVRFYVLGLSPNAARLSVRFFIEDDFGEIASRYLTHVERMRLDPPPRDDAPSIWRLLIEIASQRKSENIPVF
jgi:CRISPR-associated protein Csd1